MLAEAHPGFSGQPHSWQPPLVLSQLGWVPSPWQAWEASLGFSGKLCDLISPDVALPRLHAESAGFAQITANSVPVSLQLFLISSEWLLADHHKASFFLKQVRAGVKSESPVREG